jgi:hypothetical protein
MLMQAKFSRGGEPFKMRVHRFEYTFEANKHGDMVCDVMSEEHAKELLEMGNFQEYDHVHSARQHISSNADTDCSASTIFDSDETGKTETPVNKRAVNKRGGRGKR